MLPDSISYQTSRYNSRMGENVKWHQNWTVESLPRIAHHKSGFSVRFDPAAEPLAWDMALAKPLPEGYALDLRETPRRLYEALRIWQARAWDGRYLPACVVTDGKAFDLASIIAASRMPAGAMTQMHVDALLEQWTKARRRLLS